MIDGRKNINNPFRQNDYSYVKTIRVHKEQFDAIEKNAETVIVICKEDGRSIAFNKVIGI